MDVSKTYELCGSIIFSFSQQIISFFFLVEVIHVFLENAFLADILNSFESLILQKILNPWFLYLDGKRFFRQQIL